MSFFVKETRGKVQKIEDKGNYSVVNFSTSRKDQRTNEYVYSSWGFTRFVSKAHQYLTDNNVQEGDILTIKNGAFSREPYEKDGQRNWPKSAQLVVFDCELYRKNVNDQAQSESDATDKAVQEDEDLIPF